jgi:glycosyltransferase involved in cell wall biosynthesis
VTDDVGCQPDLVTDGVEGAVYPVGDVAALTDALRRVLADHEAMGQRALERVKQWSFDADVVGLREALAQVTRKLPAGDRA